MQQTFSVLQLAILVAEQLGSRVPEAAILPKRLAKADRVPLPEFQDALRRTLVVTDPMYDPRQPLPTDTKAVASCIWRAAAHLTPDVRGIQPLAVLYIMDRLGYRLLCEEPKPEITFDHFQVWLDGKRWTEELLGLKSDDPESARRFHEIRDYLHELQAKSYRLCGQGHFSFVADTWSQLEWYRSVITDEQLLIEGIRERLRRAFSGLRKIDGLITRSDEEVHELIVKIRQRMTKRRKHLEDLRVAIRGICGLSPDAPIFMRIHGDSIHFNQLMSLTVRRVRAKRSDDGKPIVIAIK